MTRIAGLASNRGRNLLHIDDKQPGGATLDVGLSDHADAPVLDAAADRGIPAEPVEHADGDSREAHERLLLDALGGYDVDLVCLDGYMRILTPEFLEAVPPTLNVHPSLLPAFPGDNAHEQVLDAGVRVTGCTVHVVTATVDDGPIVTQEAIPVYADDDADSLKRRVLYDTEFAAYPRAVRWFAQDRLRIDGGVGATDTTVTVDGERFVDLSVDGRHPSVGDQLHHDGRPPASRTADRRRSRRRVAGEPRVLDDPRRPPPCGPASATRRRRPGTPAFRRRRRGHHSRRPIRRGRVTPSHEG